jgi:thymidylate synthase
MERMPRPFPKLVIRSGEGEEKKKKSIDDFVFEDFEIVGYDPHKSIAMKMAV